MSNLTSSEFDTQNNGYSANIYFGNGKILKVPKDRIRIGKVFLQIMEDEKGNNITGIPIMNIDFIAWVKES